MKTLQQIRDEVSKEFGYDKWAEFAKEAPLSFSENVSKRYAHEVAKEALKNAVNHLDVDDFEYLHRYGKCFKNILSETNIPKEVRL